jgi:hypothetical protein
MPLAEPLHSPPTILFHCLILFGIAVEAVMENGASLPEMPHHQDGQAWNTFHPQHKIVLAGKEVTMSFSFLFLPTTESGRPEGSAGRSSARSVECTLAWVKESQP